MRTYKHAIGMFTPLVRVTTPNSPISHGRDSNSPSDHGSQYYRVNDEEREKWNNPDAILKAKRGNVRGLAHPTISQILL